MFHEGIDRQPQPQAMQGYRSPALKEEASHNPRFCDIAVGGIVADINVFIDTSPSSRWLRVSGKGNL